MRIYLLLSAIDGQQVHQRWWYTGSLSVAVGSWAGDSCRSVRWLDSNDATASSLCWCLLRRQCKIAQWEFTQTYISTSIFVWVKTPDTWKCGWVKSKEESAHWWRVSCFPSSHEEKKNPSSPKNLFSSLSTRVYLRVSVLLLFSFLIVFMFW